MPPVYQEIRHKLELLKQQDQNLKIFGANKHQYHLNPCLTEAEIQTFEQCYQITLPQDYRDFLLYVGNGGAGPEYGLFSLEESVREVQENMIEIPEDNLQRLLELSTSGRISEAEYLEIQAIQNQNRNFIANKLNQGEVNYNFLIDDFPLTNVDASDAITRRMNLQTDEFYFIEAEYPLNGCLPISHRGCGWMSILVITGEQRGKMWIAGDGWLPVFSYEQATQKNFLSWYREWLNNSVLSTS